jgi:hypothetical protein
MSLRVFRDQGGHEWKVWDVVPNPGRPASDRRAADRRVPPPQERDPERRTGRERRRDAGLFTPGLEAGWLCFENGEEKRRLTPIPSGWQGAPAPTLAELLARARRVPRRHLLDEDFAG